MRRDAPRHVTLFHFSFLKTIAVGQPTCFCLPSYSELLLPDEHVGVRRVGLAEPCQRRRGAGSLVVVLGRVGGGFRGAVGALPNVPPVDVAAAAGQGEDGAACGTVFATAAASCVGRSVGAA